MPISHTRLSQKSVPVISRTPLKTLWWMSQNRPTTTKLSTNAANC